MSFLDLILSQKTIILTIGIAVLLLLAAFTLALIPRLRRQRQRAAQRRAEKEQLEAVEMAEAQAQRAQVQRVETHTPAAPLSPAAPRKPGAPASAAAAAVTTASTASSESAAKPGQETPSAIQDILTSVFADEGVSERQIALMRGLDDVDIAHLLTLSQRVAAQLHGDRAVTVVGSKEIE
jgi:type II secretory pathway pseudopilin PulG